MINISIPTDLPHKFFAVGGLVVIGLGVWWPAKMHDRAEMQRIEAFEMVQRHNSAYQRYHNKQFEIMSKGLQSDDQSAKRRAHDALLDQDPEVAALKREADDAMAESSRNMQLMQHYYFMQKVWLAMGVVLVLVGIASSLFGFRKWFEESRRTI